MELTLEVIPKSTWGKNVRSEYKSDWDKIRKLVYQKAMMKCQICYEKQETLHAHEVWEFDEEDHIQKLVDIIGICEDCHNTIHYGRAKLVGTDQEAKEHFMKVNECDELDWMLAVQEVSIKSMKRNKIKDWKLDLSLVEEYLK
ncbi:HNH endonuclease [Heyndrickxia camelliae]|uniref:HNH endonuclease n=1 Tax=Heyndrickxia camelliae TaxID=1707093 RepID=A0A2N3LCQ5_9BACI|nr:HNH endonuclease [Heyndrickxia camelliae]PKR82408.1 HNH endonuclease [Heyndrickxia camelliae]